MAPRAEKLENDAPTALTTLNGAITAGAGTATLTDGSVFPADGDYRLSIDTEIVLVTVRATNVVTITRGVDGTTAATHSDGADVFIIITQEGIDQYIKDFVNPAAFNQPPHKLLNKAGSVLTKADFTNLNLGTGTVIDDAHGGISMAMAQGAAPNARVIHKSAPSTPYTVTAHVLSGIGSNAAAENANVLGFRDSGDGKLSFISFHYGTNTITQYLTTPTSAAGAPANSSTQNVAFRPDYWLKIEDDGTNLKYYTSADGYNWWEQHSELRGFWFTTGPDQIWWGGDNQGTDGEFIHLLSWAEE